MMLARWDDDDDEATVRLTVTGRGGTQTTIDAAYTSPQVGYSDVGIDRSNYSADSIKTIATMDLSRINYDLIEAVLRMIVNVRYSPWVCKLILIYWYVYSQRWHLARLREPCLCFCRASVKYSRSTSN